MNIRSWPFDKIMQLPDCAFGRRWPVAVQNEVAEVGTFYDISELALPETCVIWNCSIWSPYYAIAGVIISLAIGDVLPTDDAQFDVYEPLFRDVGVITAGRRTIHIYRSPGMYAIPMRMPVEAMGRRLVGRFERASEVLTGAYVILTVSSIPKEVPDCLLSGQGRGL